MTLLLYRQYLFSTRIVFIIGAIHLILLVFGIYYTIDDLIEAQEPVSDEDAIMMSCASLFQMLIIILLIIGTKKKKPLLILPWVVCVCVILAPISIMTLWYAIQEKILIFIFNIGLTGIYWTIWYVVYTFYRQLTNRLKYEEIYKIPQKN